MAFYWKPGAIKPTLDRTAEGDAWCKKLAKLSKKKKKITLDSGADSSRRFYSVYPVRLLEAFWLKCY